MAAHDDPLHHGCPTFFNKGLHPLLWAGSRAPSGKITVSVCKCVCVCKCVWSSNPNTWRP
jgi:hypothetical protein